MSYEEKKKNILYVLDDIKSEIKEGFPNNAKEKLNSLLNNWDL